MAFGFGFAMPHGASVSFSPASLFAAGEPGVWYDPSDVANLSWRRNLLPYTEQFDNAAWTKANLLAFGSGSVANATAAPDGTTTADLITPDTTNSFHRVVYTQGGISASTDYTASIYCKPNGYTKFGLTENFTTGAYAAFECVGAGSVLDTGFGASGSISAVGNGWYRLTLTVTTTVAQTSFRLDANVLAPSYTTGLPGASWVPDGTSGVYIWGAQLEVGSAATEYQRITDVHTEVRERFPKATLFQDTAGTQPVTTAGQSVALMLDKSRGLTLGPELVTNGGFDSDTAWTKGTGWTISGGAASANISAGTSLDQSLTTTINKTYQVTFTISNYISGGIRARFTGSANISGAVRSAVGTYTELFLATATNNIFRMVDGGAGFVGAIDNISVRELPGNHATQAITASRPIYAVEPVTGRRNLLTYTEQFDNAVWTTIKGGTVSTPVKTPNYAEAPDGTITACRLQITSNGASSSADFGLLRTGSGLGTGVDLTSSVWLKSNTGSNQSVTLRYNGEESCVVVATPEWGYFTATNGTGVGAFDVGIRGNVSANDDLDISIWRPQAEFGSTATAYQRVVSKYDVTEAGVPSRSYLSFDGIDDFMVTPTITPGIDKAQVFAGVRKLSDTAYQMVAEYSANVTTQNGACCFLSTSGAGAAVASALNFGLRGTATASYDATSFPTGTTFVGSAQFDIAGADVAAEVRPRINGTIPALTATAAANAGTGNFGNYPLYIGRRGGVSLPFNGNIYGMIVRFGANLSGSQVIATENWLTARTIPASRWINAPEPVPAVGEAHQGGFYFGQIWDEITTSTNSVAIATGRQSFSVSNTAPLFYAGQTVKVVSRADAGNRIMEGKVVQSYDNVLVVDVTSTTGSGTYTDWSVLAKYRLIVAPKSSGENSGVAYKNASTAAPVAAQTLTNGPAATAAMVAADSSTVYPLAHWADGLSIGGYTDWYVPARDELELIWRNLKPVTNNNSTGDRPKSSIVYANGGNQNDVSGDDHGVNRHSEPTGAAYTTSDPGQTSVTAFRSGNSEALEFTSTFYWSSSEFSSSNGWGQFYSPSVPGNQGNTNKTNSFKARAIRRSLV